MCFLSQKVRGNPYRAVLDKHYMRKHGPDAYYGQRGRNATEVCFSVVVNMHF